MSTPHVYTACLYRMAMDMPTNMSMPQALIQRSRLAAVLPNVANVLELGNPTTLIYRADWEPEAASGKCMAGVPGVFWRSPAVLWGPSIHNPAWV